MSSNHSYVPSGTMTLEQAQRTAADIEQRVPGVRATVEQPRHGQLNWPGHSIFLQRMSDGHGLCWIETRHHAEGFMEVFGAREHSHDEPPFPMVGA